MLLCVASGAAVGMIVMEIGSFAAAVELYCPE